MINKNKIRELLMVNVEFPTNHIEQTLVDSALKGKTSVLLDLENEEVIDLRTKGFLVKFDKLQQEWRITW